MGLLDRFKRQAKAAVTKLPFVTTVGYEKTYGRPAKTDFAAQVEQYKSWAYACTNRNAYSVAKCELKLFKRTYTDKGANLQEIYNHPFLELMRNVNPFMNRFELWTITQTFLDLIGNNYWWLVKDGLKVPRAVWNIPGHWVKIVPSKTKFIAGYVVKVPGVEPPIPFDEEDIVHFKYPSPFDLYYGTSPTLAACYGVDLNNQIKTWGLNFFMNNAQPSGILTTEDSLTESQYERLRDQWNSKYRGSANAGKMAILERGLQYQQTGSDLSKMKFNDLTDSVRDEILAIFGVPASKLGLVEDVNRANADANDYTYQKDTILPRLKLIEEKINEKLLPMYDPSLVCQFVSPVPEDKEFRLREQTEHINSGYSSIDNEREKDNEDTYNLPETEVPLITMNKIPAGTPPEEDPEEDPMMIPDDNEEEDDKDDDKKKPPKKSYSVAHKARRDRKWLLFDKLTMAQERLLKDRLRSYFSEQHSEVMRNFNKIRAIKETVKKEGIAGNIMFNMDEQNEKLRKVSGPHIKESYTTGVNFAVEEAGIDFTLIEPNIMRAVNKRIMFFSEEVNETTRKLIVDGIEKGDSIDDIASNIDEVFGYNSKVRSTRIARTEVIGATNEGQYDAVKDSGVEEKEWLTAKDERVRQSHSYMDGQRVKITDTFTTGEGNKLMFPGDRSTGAPPSDIVNCRCTFITSKV